MLAALARKAGQQRKCRVADEFYVFLRTRTSNERGWQTTTDADVFEWLYWFDSHGHGTKLVNVVMCPGVGLDDGSQYSSGESVASGMRQRP